LQDHSFFDAFLHSHANISDTARHSWNGTAQSSSANIHWPSVIVVRDNHSCRGNDGNDSIDGNAYDDSNDDDNDNDGNDDNDGNEGNDGVYSTTGTTNSFFITREY